MSKNRVEPLYRKTKLSVAVEKWLIVYMDENNINKSELVNKLLKQWIKGQN